MGVLESSYVVADVVAPWIWPIPSRRCNTTLVHVRVRSGLKESIVEDFTLGIHPFLGRSKAPPPTGKRAAPPLYLRCPRRAAERSRVGWSARIELSLTIPIPCVQGLPPCVRPLTGAACALQITFKSMLALDASPTQEATEVTQHFIF